MSVNGVNGSQGNPNVVGVQSQGTTVSNTSTTPSTEPQAPLVQGQASQTESTQSEIPSPVEEGGDLAERYAFVEQELERLEDLDGIEARREELEVLLESDVPSVKEAAQAALDELDRLVEYQETLEKEEERLEGLLSDVDLDNPIDKDGDGLTDDFERVLGSNPYSNDTDHDGILDSAEVAVRDGKVQLKEILGYEWTDINNGDADHNGVVDGNQLPLELRAQFVPGVTIPGTGGPGTGGTTVETGTGGETAGVQTRPLLWTSTTTDANQVNASGGNQTVADNGRETVVNLSGEVTFDKDGRNLLIGTEDGTTITMLNFFDEEGKAVRILHIEGEITAIEYKQGIYPADLGAVDLNGDGYADAGVRIASGPPPENVSYDIDPFEGRVPYTDVDGERRYDVTEASGFFEIPEMAADAEGNVKEVKQVYWTQEGGDVVVELKGKDGELIRRFRLIGGAARALGENPPIKFKGHDKGLLGVAIDLPIWFVAGDGNDMYKGLGHFEGGKGSDIARAEVSDSSHYQAVTFDMGEGDDNASGGNLADRIDGGAGMDIIYSGMGADTDVMNGGADDDIIIGQVADGRYIIDGGGGDYNISNISGPNAENVHGPAEGLAVLDLLGEKLGEDLEGDRRDRLEEAKDWIEMGQASLSDQIRDLVLQELGREAGTRQVDDYGIESTREPIDIPEPAIPGRDDEPPEGGGAGP